MLTVPSKRFMAFLFPLLVLGLMLHFQPPTGAQPAPPALTRLSPMTVQARAFEASAATKPLQIRSLEEAAAYLSAEDLTGLIREVDFSRQQVLLFAWRGSGQDSLEAALDKSAATFTYSPGRTRDLREHHRVFVLRSDLPWSVR